eukprot:g19704.t1
MGAWWSKLMQPQPVPSDRTIDSFAIQLQGVSTCQDEMSRNMSSLFDRVKKLERSHLVKKPEDPYLWHLDNNPLTKGLDGERRERLGLLHRIQDLELQVLEIPHQKKILRKLFLYVRPDEHRDEDDPYPWWDGNRSEWSPSEAGS